MLEKTKERLVQREGIYYLKVDEGVGETAKTNGRRG